MGNGSTCNVECGLRGVGRGAGGSPPPPEQDPVITLDLTQISWRGVSQNDRTGQARRFRGLNTVLLDT